MKRNVPYSSETGAAWMNYLWSSWTGSALWQRIWKRYTVSLKVCTVTKFDVLKNKLSEKQTKQLIHFCFHFITVSWFLQFSIKDAGNFARSLQHRNIPNLEKPRCLSGSWDGRWSVMLSLIYFVLLKDIWV